MSRRPKPVPFGEADLLTGELRRAPRSRRWLTITVVIALLVLVAAVAYAVTFAPDHYAKWRAERLVGDATVEIGGGAQAVPGDGWVVQPRVTNLVEWPPLPPLRDWAVLTGDETGIELLSPDRGLSVELSIGAESEESDTAWLKEVAPGTEGNDEKGAAQMQLETLASGAELTHVDGREEIRAIVSMGATKVRVLGRTDAAASSADSADSASSADSNDGTDSGDTALIDEYRPVLSALLESITAG